MSSTVSLRELILAGGLARSHVMDHITQTSPYTSANTYSAEHTWWALADSNCISFLSEVST